MYFWLISSVLLVVLVAWTPAADARQYQETCVLVSNEQDCLLNHPEYEWRPAVKQCWFKGVQTYPGVGHDFTYFSAFDTCLAREGRLIVLDSSALRDEFAVFVGTIPRKFFSIGLEKSGNGWKWHNGVGLNEALYSSPAFWEENEPQLNDFYAYFNNALDGKYKTVAAVSYQDAGESPSADSGIACQACETLADRLGRQQKLGYKDDKKKKQPIIFVGGAAQFEGKPNYEGRHNAEYGYNNYEGKNNKGNSYGYGNSFEYGQNYDGGYNNAEYGYNSEYGRNVGEYGYNNNNGEYGYNNNNGEYGKNYGYGNGEYGQNGRNYEILNVEGVSGNREGYNSEYNNNDNFRYYNKK